MLEKNDNNMEEIESFYKSHLTHDFIQKICQNTAEDIIEKYFVSNTIDNASYEQNIFKIIKKTLISFLIDSFDNEPAFNAQLSIYIFKKHFRLIFDYLSEFIIEEVAYSNTNVIDFLKYYSLNTIVVERKKYVVPQIKVEDGPRWNVTSMLSIVKTYVKTLDQLEQVNHDLQTIQDKILTYYVEGVAPGIHNERIEKKFAELEERMKNNASRIDIINDSLAILTDKTTIARANKELEEAQNERLLLKGLKPDLVKSRIKQIKILEYQALLAQAENLQRDISPKYKTIEQNKEAYLSIKNALIKALISKKQAL